MPLGAQAATESVALVTGSNRGIGLALARELRTRGRDVVAVVRAPTTELQSLGVRIADGCDVADPATWSTLATQLARDELDLLVHNAGVAQPDELATVTPDEVRRQLETNALAPLFLTRALLPRMRQGGKIALITSRMGSMGDNGSGAYYGYRMSKAALNAAGVSLARDLAPRGIAVVILHPGPVRTDMNPGGSLAAADAAVALLQRVEELTLATTGRFLHVHGQELPW
jgi:NAD(P)-dependent dehydrogenase (short-subunit alcohol dehydrogenase family)